MGRLIKPSKWVHYKGKWDKKAGLVGDSYLLDLLEIKHDMDPAHVLLYRSKWHERLYHRFVYLPSSSLSSWWSKSLNTNQRLSISSIVIASATALLVAWLTRCPCQ